MSDKVTAQSFRQTKEIVLPSGLKVVCYSSLLIGDLVGVKSNEDNFDANLEIVVKVIKSWDFYDDAGEKILPVCIENFKKLPAPDFQTLVDELKIFSDTKKKI